VRGIVAQSEAQQAIKLAALYCGFSFRKFKLYPINRLKLPLLEEPCDKNTSKVQNRKPIVIATVCTTLRLVWFDKT
jgi:hypothetical protein